MPKPASARNPLEVNGFSWSLTQPLEPENRLGSGQRSVTVVRESACQPARQLVIQSVHSDCRMSVIAISQQTRQTRQLVLYVIDKAFSDQVTYCGDVTA